MNSSSSIKKLLNAVKEKSQSFLKGLDNVKKAMSEKIKHTNGKLGDFFKEKGLFENKDFNNIDEEKVLKVGLSLIAVVLVATAVNIKTIAYDISLRDENIGIVRREEDLNNILDEIKDELSSTYNMDVVFNEEIDIKKVHALNESITTSKDLKLKIKNKMNFCVQAYALIIDGETVGALKTKEEVEGVIEQIKEPYKKEIEKDGKLEKIEILEDIKIKKIELPYYQLSSEEKLHERVLNGGEDIKVHTVEVGESLWTIAQIYNTSVDELIEANGDKEPEKLQIGDEVRLIEAKSLLTIATTSKIEYDEKIEYDLEIEPDTSKYKNEKEVLVKGKEGKASVVSEEVKHNGVLISKNEVSREVVEEPVKEVVKQGTREVPRTVATGVFAMPTRGRISSRYGSRNGRMHKGLDIAAKIGTPINAADGGTVVFSGYSGAYGNMIEIDHGNGYRTKYAHCSKLIVNRGDKVYKGQHIANVGNTGRSTGPHLHLEVLKNGKNQNPSNYVN